MVGTPRVSAKRSMEQKCGIKIGGIKIGGIKIGRIKIGRILVGDPRLLGGREPLVQVQKGQLNKNWQNKNWRN